MNYSNAKAQATFLLLLISSSFLSTDAQSGPYSANRANDFVPNAKTAIRIAVAVWNAMDGKKQIASKKPYKASLSGGIWLVFD